MRNGPVVQRIAAGKLHRWQGRNRDVAGNLFDQRAVNFGRR